MLLIFLCLSAIEEWGRSFDFFIFMLKKYRYDYYLLFHLLRIVRMFSWRNIIWSYYDDVLISFIKICTRWNFVAKQQKYIIFNQHWLDFLLPFHSYSSWCFLLRRADLKLDKVDINIRSKEGKYYKFINQVKSIKLWQWWNSWFQKYFRSIYTFTQRYANYFLNQNIGLEKYTPSCAHARPAYSKKHNPRPYYHSYLYMISQMVSHFHIE